MRRRLITSVAVAALLLPIAADRIAAGVIEHRVAARVRCVAGLTAAPDVDLRGFPALTQLASRSFGEIRVTADEVQLPKIALGHVEADAKRVSLAAGGASAGSVTVDATVPYSALTGLGAAAKGGPATGGPATGGPATGGPATGGPATGGPATGGTAADGTTAGGALAGSNMRIVGADDAQRLVVQADISVRGLTVPATVYADVKLSGNRLAITPVEVELSSIGLRVPASRLPAAASAERAVDLPALPGGLTYRSVTPAADGLHVIAGGADLHLTNTNKINSNDKTCGGTA
ncbi:LmeA family phospholipid-binding protein [Actinoplanes sp. NPDC026619]|uniref:LmeA family phospholipid-binding protein n=1 Tax=Actinoplanes sp. NPDC026619 TaxID=3155798 RepID=UPI0033C49B40